MITSTDIAKLLADAGVMPQAIKICDSNYLLPTPAWITGAFGTAYEKSLESIGVQFAEDKFDCNAFAQLACAHARLCWSKTQSADAALAFGFVALAGLPGHALNLAVHRNGVGLYLALYEPQPVAVPAIGQGGQPTERLVCLQPSDLSLDCLSDALLVLFA